MLCDLHVFVSRWQDPVRGCVTSKRNPETRTRLASVKAGVEGGGWPAELKAAEEQSGQGWQRKSKKLAWNHRMRLNHEVDTQRFKQARGSRCRRRGASRQTSDPCKGSLVLAILSAGNAPPPELGRHAISSMKSSVTAQPTYSIHHPVGFL